MEFISSINYNLHHYNYNGLVYLFSLLPWNCWIVLSNKHLFIVSNNARQKSYKTLYIYRMESGNPPYMLIAIDLICIENTCRLKQCLIETTKLKLDIKIFHITVRP